jgi:hypothetical protein
MVSYVFEDDSMLSVIDDGSSQQRDSLHTLEIHPSQYRKAVTVNTFFNKFIS